MDIQDVLFDSNVSLSLKTALLEFAHGENCLYPYTRILIPTDQNNDVNGSQHHSETINFTYREATMDDLESASTLGYYEYFSNYYDTITGHYYNGDGRHFEAIVLDPPAYAASVTL